MPTPPLTLWQTEWCPSSRRVRQRLTELGVSYVIRQVPVERVDRHELLRATGQEVIPALVADDRITVGEGAIVAYLNGRFVDPPEAGRQRAKAEKARRKELEQACQKLSAATR